MRLETVNNEIERMATLHETGLMNDTCEMEFTQLVTLAAEICGMPIAAFSVVSEQIVRVKAAVGAPVGDIPRDGAFCAHVVQQREPLVVKDTLSDPIFCSLLPVTDGGLRFYAGVPLSAPNGQVLGTLCVADTKPRSLTTSQRAALDVLGVQLCTRIELRLQQRRLQEALGFRIGYCLK